jgi:lysozyme
MNARTIVAGLSASALIGLAIHEGFRDTAYDDGVGVQTIGFGTTEGVKPGDRITVERALVRLGADVDKYAQAVKRCAPVPMYQYEFDASVTLAYNIGAGAFCGSTVAKRFNAGDYSGACAAFDLWVYAGGKKLNGLVKRRAAERALCEGRGTDKS